MSANAVIFCHHDSRLVVLSILISILAAFAARELVGRINEAQGKVWLAWLAGTAVVDGIGTWSMHYTGKLACHLPVPLLFDWRMVLLSLLVAISGSAAACLVLARRKFGWGRAVLGASCSEAGEFPLCITFPWPRLCSRLHSITPCRS